MLQTCCVSIGWRSPKLSKKLSVRLCWRSHQNKKKHGCFWCRFQQAWTRGSANILTIKKQQDIKFSEIEKLLADLIEGRIWHFQQQQQHVCLINQQKKEQKRHRHQLLLLKVMAKIKATFTPFDWQMTWYVNAELKHHSDQSFNKPNYNVKDEPADSRAG